MRPPIDAFKPGGTLNLLEVLCRDTPLSLTTDVHNVQGADESELADDLQARVCLFAVADSGHSVALQITGYKPSLMFEVPIGLDADSLVKSVLGKSAILAIVSYKQLKRFQGYVPDAKNPLEAAKFNYAVVRMNTFKAVRDLKWKLKQKMPKLSFVNESIKESTQFCNELGLTMSGWFSIKDFETMGLKRRDKDFGWSTCQIEIDLDRPERLFAVEKNDLPPQIACSFDCEMFSIDGLLPNVSKGDFTTCLCATIWRTDLENTYERHAFLLSNRLKNRDVLHLKEFVDDNLQVVKLHFVETSASLIEAFRDFLVEIDIDILTGWNIYDFDMPFLFQEWSAYFSPVVERGTQGFSQALWNQVNKTHRPSTADLLARARHTVPWTSIQAICKKQATSSLPKHADQWPESVASPMRKDLAQLLFENASVRPEDIFPGRMPTKNDIVKMSEDPLISDELKSLAKAILQESRASNDNRGLFWNRLRTEPSHLEIRQMASAAKGDNTYKIWTCTGRVTVDLMQIIKDDKKPESNSLKFAAETWLDKDKLKKDLTPEEMFANYANGEWTSLAVLMDQCARDSEIPMLLIQKLSQVPAWVEMSRVTQTSLAQVLNGGQQRKVFNVIARFVHDEQAINVEDSGWPKEILEEDHGPNSDPLAKRKPDQQGATVIEPEPGHYTDPVSVLDFESLYPSIIIFFNLCASNLVLTEFSKDILECPGFEMEVHEIVHNILVDLKTMEYKTEIRKQAFIKHIIGVLPRLLRHLLKSRKAVKALMAAETDPFKKAVLNGRQNGLKIVCNSVYGFCGVSASKGLLPCKPVAAVTTLKGRTFIDAAKNQVEKTQVGSKVLQGDSVTKDTLVLVRLKERIMFLSFENLDILLQRIGFAFEEWHDTKYAAEVPLEVWSERGFVKCPRIIRHVTQKKLFRVMTTQGIVDVTEDHSMVLENSEICKPMDLVPGTRLLAAKPLWTRETLSSLDSSYWAETNSKRPANTILYATSKYEATVVIHDMLGFGYSLQQIREDPTFQELDEDEFELQFSLEKTKVECIVTSVRPLQTSMFQKVVQDLQTENHHFHVCPGNLVVHNTDSIMIRWPKYLDDFSERPQTIPEAQNLGEEASKAITKVLREGLADNVTMPALADSRNAVTLANEKVQCPYLLIKKKNYAGIKWTPSSKAVTKVPGFGYELDMKGIDAVRRDRTKMVRELSENLLQVLLVENDAEASLKVLSSRIEDILNDKVPLSDFVLSKSLKGSYDSENVPHVQAWRRMQARGDPGCPTKGGRMPMLIVDPQGPQANLPLSKVPLQMRAEHPDFVARSNGAVKICKQQQLSGLQEPIERLQGPTQFISQVQTIFQKALDTATHLASKSTTLSQFSTDSHKEEDIFEHLEPVRKKTKKADKIPPSVSLMKFSK